ncbi:MAG TPA: chloride channel protein [Caulobacteraceae bacterium]|jgi:CIC family chloride channel protein|nr:chloride channel protein [Caulobacteraceae bacterium]
MALEGLAFLRGQIRASELWLVVIASGVGAAAGLATIAIGMAAHALQELWYNIDFDERLSAATKIAPERFVALPIGGALLVLAGWLWARGKRAQPVDPVEANALRGGRMSFRDSLFVALQTIISNGFGASVGLEAAYAQMGGAVASVTGRALNLRRNDLRTFVGAGAGAAIGAAFGAPLTGAFYAFEIIIGSYTIANIAPVVAASLAAVLMTHLAHFEPMVVRIGVAPDLSLSHYLLFSGLGLVCAFFGIGVMRLVGFTEQLTGRISRARPYRPIVGGALLAGLALVSSQTLSAGHGAMHLDLTADLGIAALVFLIITKAMASVVSLGFGFRGGLFFASLYLGSLVGRLYAVILDHWTTLAVDPLAASLVGMGALAVSIVGGPFTMSFLVLETTGDFGLTAATLTASIVASVIVRETFGYSFSTWRLHLRGETIRSAHDVGWLRTLTAGRMMRTGAPTIAADAPLAEFRHRFPLGSTRRVVALAEGQHYAGIVPSSAVYADADGEGHVADMMILADEWLTPEMNIKEIMSVFDRTGSDELAVLGAGREVLGVLTEAYATRRYAEELEKNRRDLVGGD